MDSLNFLYQTLQKERLRSKKFYMRHCIKYVCLVASHLTNNIRSTSRKPPLAAGCLLILTLKISLMKM